MKQIKGRMKLNNKGVTLVELMVAMLILSIVSIAFYNGFVISAKTNAKAKIQHQATSLAQNVMEGLKSADIEEILKEFSYPIYTDAEGNTVNQFGLISGSLMPMGVTDSVGTFGTYVSSIDSNGNCPDYVKTEDGKYYLYLEQAAMENTKLDVLITLDGSAYMSSIISGGVETSVNKGQTYNSNPLAQIPTMDANYDAVLSQTVNGVGGNGLDGIALGELKTKTGNDSLQYVDRTIVVTVTDSLQLSGNHLVKVQADYTYKSGTEVYLPSTDYVFDNTNNIENDLRHIFIFFQPMYGCKDTIIINNPNDKDIEVYLVKLESGAASLQSKENAYMADVMVNESALASEVHTKIRTNLGTNLATGTEVLTQVSYYQNGSLVASPSVFDVRPLTNDGSQDTIFDVTVEVFPSVETDFSGMSPDEVRALLGESKAVLTGTIRN